MIQNVPALWIGVLAAIDIPVFYFYGKLLFGDLQGFIDAVWFWFKPDLWSFLDNQFFEDWWAEFKLGLFFATCGAAIAAEYFFVVAPYILHVAPAS